MLISNYVYDKLVRTLALGCFPREVLSFQESQEFFEQIVFVDYQLQLLIQNEFAGVGTTAVAADEFHSPSSKLHQLIDYAHSITANYSSVKKGYEENLYYAVVLSQIYFLDRQWDRMNTVLNEVTIVAGGYESPALKAFIDYLSVRHTVLLGLTDTVDAHNVWIQFLSSWNKPLSKSQVAANQWLDILFEKLTHVLTSGELRPLQFNDIRMQKFGENTTATITYSTFLLRPENSQRISSSFKLDYVAFLAHQLDSRISFKDDVFPHAHQDSDDYEDYVTTVYESLSRLSYTLNILKPSLSKTFLVKMTLKTYQSQVVLSNLVNTLLDLNEYDEALAAFKTYISYVEKDQEQHGGHIPNILAIIDTYANCISKFNPMNSFVPKVSMSRKFKYTSSDRVLESLEVFTKKLLFYLHELARYADLTYDSNDELKENRLSFLYHKYNVNVLLNDLSEFIGLISKAWFSLGYYYNYLATIESPTPAKLRENADDALLYYKNSLIVNSTGNATYLFNYALALSHDRQLEPALKLCKFILKKYPESFKTWNLLVLLFTAFETHNPDYVKSANKPSTLPTVFGSNGTTEEQAQKNLKESEKFINNALNIAGIFISKHKSNDIKLTTETKHDILQLKLTQFSVWESVYGVQYVLEYLSDVFSLYHELFADVEIHESRADTISVLGGDVPGIEGKWSHRPTVIDPSPAVKETPISKLLREKEVAKDTIRRFSKITQPRSTEIRVKAPKDLTNPNTLRIHNIEKKILQDLWLWTSGIYLKIGLLEEAEQCIVEAETNYEPNVKTYTQLGFLTSKTRKFLSLQEFERSLEILTAPENYYKKKEYGTALLGLCKLFMVDDDPASSLFTSNKDLNAGLIRLKNMLERYSNSWHYGLNNSELWWYLSLIYEKIDDKILYTKSLWKCVELEDCRPVRAFDCCDSFSAY